MFVRITQKIYNEYGNRLDMPCLINLNNIAMICYKQRMLLLNANDGKDGWIYVTKEDIENILEHIEICGVE